MASGSQQGRPVVGVAPAAPSPARRAARVVAAVISALLLFGFGYGWWSYRDLNSNLQRLDVFGAQTRSSHDIDGAAQNILVVGNDDRTGMTDAEVSEFKVGRDGGSMATDTMLIVHVPADGKKASLISLPRDAYVEIPGHGMNKLNSAFASGYNDATGTPDQRRTAAASLLIETVQHLTGLHIDHYAQVSLLGFVRISDAVGGVTVNLCHAVDDTRAHNIANGIPGGSGLKLSAGKHSIQGVTALEFVRQREQLPRGDIDREARQRYFLTAAFRKVASAGTLLDPARLHSLISAIDRSIYVDPGFNVLDLARQVSGLSANNIAGQNIPFGGFETIDGIGSVEAVDPAQVQQWVRGLIGIATPDPLAKVTAAAPSSVTVSVLNGGTQNGAAAANATKLHGYGFTTSFGDSPTTVQTTTVRYAADMRAQAKALLRYLPAGVTAQQADVSTLTLVLGSDGLGVQAPHPAGSASGSASGTHKAATKPIDSGCIN